MYVLRELAHYPIVKFAQVDGTCHPIDHGGNAQRGSPVQRTACGKHCDSEHFWHAVLDGAMHGRAQCFNVQRPSEAQQPAQRALIPTAC